MMWCKIIIIKIVCCFHCILCYQLGSNNKQAVSENKVNITVFYETLCPGSVDFFKEQLGPTVEKLSRHVNVHLVPYGYAKVKIVNERNYLECQHGYYECVGNILHACVIEKLHKTKAVLLNTCLIQKYTTFGYFQHCCYIVGVRKIARNQIWSCLRNNRVGSILNRYGEETRIEDPEYLPYVLLNGVLNRNAQSNLMSIVCEILQPTPTACEHV